jgi:hypothetical protein
VIKRLVASVVLLTLLGTALGRPSMAQGVLTPAARALGAKLCAAPLLTNKDLNGYKRLKKAAIAALRDQMRQCHAYLLTLQAADEASRTPFHPLSPAQVALCDPKAAVRDDDDPNVVATLLNSYCGGLAAFRPEAPYQLSAAQLLYVAKAPTIYVIMSAGGGRPSSADSGSDSSSGTASSAPSALGAPIASGPSVTAPATTPSAANSNNDNMMLYLVARRLREAYCARTGMLTRDGECDTSRMLAEPAESPRRLSVVPESQWKIEDFRTQCAGDPYIAGPEGRGGHGTIGAIILNGSTSTQDGAFKFAVVTGRSEVNYTAEVLSCDALTDQAPFAQQLWAENITRSKSTQAFSFYLPALIGALMAVNVTSKSAFIPQPVLNAPSSAVQQFTNFQVYSTLGTFAANSSGLVIGNPNSAISMRNSYEQLADQIVRSFNAACGRGTAYANLAICRKYEGQP